MGFGSFFSGILGGGGSSSGSASNSTANTTNVTVDTKPIADAITATSENTNALFKAITDQSGAGLRHLDDTLISLIQSQNYGNLLQNDKSNEVIKYGLLMGGAFVAFHLTPKRKGK